MYDQYARFASRIRVPTGFLLAGIFLAFAMPTPRTLLLGSLLAAVGLIVRIASAGYLDKNSRLVTDGPYAHVRNPLYLGSAISGIGFCIAAGRWWLILILAGFLAAVYWPVLSSEEQRLRRLFPEEFPAYAQSVPLLWPRWRPWRGREVTPAQFDWMLFLRNREYKALLAYGLIVFLLWMKMRWFSASQ